MAHVRTTEGQEESGLGREICGRQPLKVTEEPVSLYRNSVEVIGDFEIVKMKPESYGF